MSLFKKIMVVVASASFFALCGCKVTETDEIRISEVSANIDSEFFRQKAVAKVSNDTSNGQDQKVSTIFSSDGTMIYSKNSSTGEQLIITYRGKTAGTYKTGVASTDTVVTNVLNYLVSGNSTFSASNFAEANANVTYIDKDNVKWYSTLCKIIINGQSNGNTLSLINGSFECDVYKAGETSQKKSVSGTISNVVGIQ